MFESFADNAHSGAVAVDDEFFDRFDPGPEPPIALSRFPTSAGLALELEFGVGAVQDLADSVLEDVITSYARVAAWAQAHQSHALAELARRAAADPERAEFVVEEVATALHLSAGAARAALSRAVVLDTHLDATRTQWEQGSLDERRVAAIVDGTGRLAADVATAVEARVLPRAPGQTVAQVRAAVRRAVIAADPEGARERAEQGRARRRVALRPAPDGQATLAATMDAADGTACFESLTRLARGLGSTDPRKMDARRSDLLVGLITGKVVVGDPDEGAQVVRPVRSAKPLVRVTVDLDTLTGRREQPGELAGYGPITADAARAIAADAVWIRLVTDPLSGTVLDHGRTRYHPPAALADLIRARDGRCMFPGCRRAAENCVLDHTTPFPDGPTSTANLYCLCGHHHRLRHESAWTVTSLPDGGLEWTSPTGRTHIVRPLDHRPEPAPTSSDQSCDAVAAP